jgi:hypothetical protein
MTRLMMSVPFVFVALSVASSSVVAYDVQPVDFKPKRALTLRDLPRGGVKLIPHNGCCSAVNGACLTWCRKTEGCTGSGDCSVD